MKKGIALIELIFAIVVIGITLMAVPNLIATTTKASRNAVTQESISSAVSHISMVMSEFWDENSIDPQNNNPVLVVDNQNGSFDEYGVPIPNPTNPNPMNPNPNNPSPTNPNPTNPANGTIHYGYSRRGGSPISSSRRYAVDKFGNKLKASTSFGMDTDDNNSADDVDDFNGQETVLVQNTNASAEEGDFKDKSIKIKTTVNYISDNPTSGSDYNQKDINFNNPFNNTSAQSTNIKAITVRLSSTNIDRNVTLKAFSCNIGSSRLKERKF
ncbi:MAG: hypothetical protein DSZ06_01895 [Sulfurospirillum sp.]|nr:MAG: hypothetical protein DSZ06_01895 [Sulfurospirillum sp.]